MSLNISASIKLAAVYLLFSVVWILLSDHVAEVIAGGDMAKLHQLQVGKGILFVVLSAVLLYFTSARLYANINRSAEKYKVLSETSKEAIGEYNYATGECEVNEKLRILLGSESPVLPHFRDLFLKFVHPASQQKLLLLFDAPSQFEDNLLRLEFKIRWQGADYKDVASTVYLIRDESGQVRSCVMAIEDITEYRALLYKYQQQKKQYKNSLAMSVIRAQEQERDRWAKELHDNVCQQLTVAKIFLGEIGKDRSNGSDEVLPIINEAISTALNDIRQLSASIRPPELGNISLSEALENLVLNLRRTSRFNIQIESEELQEYLLSEEHKIMIYRVLQEQLNNIIKYASAKSVTIQLQTRQDKAWVLIKDDGVGFDPAAVKSGIGLKNIRSRVQLFRGRMDLQSAPGKGCILSAVFPL